MANLRPAWAIYGIPIAKKKKKEKRKDVKQMLNLVL